MKKIPITSAIIKIDSFRIFINEKIKPVNLTVSSLILWIRLEFLFKRKNSKFFDK